VSPELAFSSGGESSPALVSSSVSLPLSVHVTRQSTFERQRHEQQFAPHWGEILRSMHYSFSIHSLSTSFGEPQTDISRIRRDCQLAIRRAAD
jgi:hypothetical protein